MPTQFISSRRSGAGSRFARTRTRLLRFESLEPRQLLAADAADDTFEKNAFATFLYLGVRWNDEFVEPANHDGPLTITSVSPTALGARVAIVTDGTFGQGIVYYPTGVYDVEDTFTYTITDGTPGGEDTATVRIHLYDGPLEEQWAGTPIGVPGELKTFVYRVHALPSATNVSPTFWSTITWDDGVVTPAHVSRTELPNHDVEALFSFWRTFSTPRLYNGTRTLFSSLGEQTNQAIRMDAQTVVQRFDSQGGTELLIGGMYNVNDRILLLPSDSGVKFTLPGGMSNVVNEPAMHIYYDGSDMGSFVADRVVIYGQGGDDLIQVDAGITTNAQLFGQAGNDILVGGAGNDILVGGIGDDILYGFNGRDTLFGGLGRDFLQGASWNGSATADDGDLVIGSYVSFDNDVILLNQLAAQWQTGDPYSTRIATIRSSSPGLRMNETVFDDWSLDYVFGAGDLDWFWVEPTRDNFDAQANETIN
jgi:hypothetical protein